MSRFALHLNIANFVFSLFYKGEIDVQGYDAIYSPFVSNNRPEGTCFYTHVRISYGENGGPVRETCGWTPLFKGDPCWELSKNAEDLRFSFYRRKGCRPNLTATVRKDFRQVDIDCGPFYLIRDRQPVKLSNPLRYPLDQLLMIHMLAQQRGGILLHAAGVEYQGRAYLFAGISGAGKSTITGMLGSVPEIEAVNDDRIVVRKKEGLGYLAYGTPWPGEKRISRNVCLPLGGIFFIVKSKENRIRQLNVGEALQRVFPVTSVPWYHKEMAGRVMDFCGELIQHIPMYEFSFRPDASAAEYLLNCIDNCGTFE